MTFDEWEKEFSPPESYLMHFRTKGSKNGVRKYQNPDGSWTELGLQERRKREGFGERRIERKAAKYYESRIKKYRAKMNNANNSDQEAEYGKKLSLYVAKRNAANGLISKKEYRDMRKLDRKYDKEEKKLIKQEDRENRRAAKAERLAKSRANKLKYMSDEDLQKRINRLELEKKYKELNKNPVIETGAKLIKAYLESQDKKQKRELDRVNLVIRDRESKAKLVQAKAANTQAKNDLIDNLFSGKGKKKAKKELIEAKSKNQVRGAIRSAISGVITKEGRRIVDDMDEHSRVMKIGRGIKSGVTKANDKFRQQLVDALKGQRQKEAVKKKNKDKKWSRKQGQELKG